MGHNGHGINMYGVIMTLMGNIQADILTGGLSVLVHPMRMIDEVLTGGLSVLVHPMRMIDEGLIHQKDYIEICVCPGARARVRMRACVFALYVFFGGEHPLGTGTRRVIKI